MQKNDNLVFLTQGFSAFNVQFQWFKAIISVIIFTPLKIFLLSSDPP
jgi:hypothetical protein